MRLEAALKGGGGKRSDLAVVARTEENETTRGQQSLAFFRFGVKANRKVRIHRGRRLWGSRRWGTFIIPRKEAD